MVKKMKAPGPAEIGRRLRYGANASQLATMPLLGSRFMEIEQTTTVSAPSVDTELFFFRADTEFVAQGIRIVQARWEDQLLNFSILEIDGARRPIPSATVPTNYIGNGSEHYYPLHILMASGSVLRVIAPAWTYYQYKSTKEVAVFLRGWFI